SISSTFLCVLPMPSDINVNMAPPEILMALGPAIDRGTADLLVEARTAQPFRNVDEMLDFPLLAGRPLLPGGLATTTTWFALDMHARIGDSALSARALLARSAPDRIEVLNRQRSFVDE
ncbi:MAG: type II secretion system protein GspK, partial [Gammaproteobacteria bacterium]